MAVKIRLKRVGAKKSPFHRIVVTDSRALRDGRSVEELGYYNPLTEDKTVKVDVEEAQRRVKSGAKPIAAADRLFKTDNVYEQEVKAEAEVEENEEA